MISKSIINACINISKIENKVIIIHELLNHISQNYDYNDQKGNHVLEMLVDKTAVITLDKVDIEYVIETPKLLVYKPEEVNIKNVTATNVDNIEGTVKFEFDYKNKNDEGNKDIAYTHTYINISYIENPEILK